MASKIKVDQIAGSSGSTITVPTGQTLTLTDGLAVASLPTVTVAKGGTNLTSFTAGDVLYATGSTTLAKLVKGSDDDVLTLASGLPSWAAAAGGGKLGQVVQTVKTDTTSQASGGGTTYYDIAGMTVTITPTAASSKILVLTSLNIGTSNNYGGTVKMQTNVDGGAFADIFKGDASGVIERGMFALYEGGTHDQVNYNFQGLHTPTYSLTDALVFKMVWSITEATNTAYLNRSYNWANITSMTASVSSITAIEILA